ncbi:MAG: signal peptidase I, partial [Tissierellia bacterium]|nr:signal peptidase I [Tissierellia bacterium]
MTEEYTVDSRNHNESHRNHKRELMSWVITIIGALVISLFIKAFIFNATTVDGNSMYPNLHDGDKLISNRIVLFYRSPKREEIVVFQSPINENEDYIKRVIGLPNDTIDLLEGKLYVNGKPIKESYLPEDTVT